MKIKKVSCIWAKIKAKKKSEIFSERQNSLDQVPRKSEGVSIPYKQEYSIHQFCLEMNAATL